jgi:hypothetical protein
MATPLSLWMQLTAGLRTEDLESAARGLGGALGVSLDARDDLELGGLWFAYEPAPRPSSGLDHVRLRANHVEGLGWAVPHRRDLPTIAETSLVGTSLLEVGRLAARLAAVLGDAVSLAAYSVVQRPPHAAADRLGPLWRAHRLELPLAPGARVPALDCQLTLGAGGRGLDSAAAAAERILGVKLQEHEDRRLGGRYFSGPGADSALGSIAAALVRPNRIDERTSLYPRRAEHVALLDLTLLTPVLLEIGSVAAAIESATDAFEPLAYRVFGDLVGDRVLRCVEREFTSRQDAASALVPRRRSDA